VHDITSWRKHHRDQLEWRVAPECADLRQLRTGLYLGYGGWTVSGIVSYDNSTGIQSQGYHSDNTIANSLVYDSRDRGVWLDNVQTSNGTLSLTNNTVMELNADAVQIINNSQNVRLKNNILWAGGAGHYALNVANTAQRGFSSDYNLIYFTGGAKFGFWQNDFATLADWRYELGFDTHSLSADPLFVDGDGNDNVRGLQEYGGLKFEYFGQRELLRHSSGDFD